MAATLRGRYLWSRCLLAALLALGWLASLPPASVLAATQTVSNTDDSGPGSLRQAILDSALTVTADTIVFALPGSHPWTIILASSLPTIETAVTIQGPGRDKLTIQGTNAFPSLIVQAPATVVGISNLTLAGGAAIGGYGGNLRSTAVGTLTLTDLALIDGAAAANQGGAGAYLSNGTYTLTRVLVNNNTAPGSAEYGAGAGLYLDEFYGDTVATITDSVITGNVAVYDGGGVALARTSTAGGRALNLALTNTVVSGNSTSGRGGGVATYKGNLTLTGSTVADNTAANGGGLYSFAATTTLISSTVSGNNGGADGGGNGGGLTSLVGPATLTSSTVSGNSAVGDGGGIFLGSSNLGLTNSTVSGNQAGGKGGGVASVSGTTTLSFATVVGNSASGGGGLSGYSAATTVLERSIVAGNVGSEKANCLIDNATSATLVSRGYNLLGGGGCPASSTDVIYSGALVALLDPALAANGGPTRTHNLVAGSPARDRIPLISCSLGNDQRGFVRPQPVGGLCDIGAVEYTPPAPSPSPSPSPSPAPTVALTVIMSGGNAVGRGPAGTGSGPYAYAVGTLVTLTPQPAAGQTFTGWLVDGVNQGWPTPLTITMNAVHTVQATFAPTKAFPDVGSGRADFVAIRELASRGTILGYANGTYGPDNTVRREEMAALIARATPKSVADGASNLLVPPACTVVNSWDCEVWTDFTFKDIAQADPKLRRDIQALAHYGAARGYANGNYGPKDNVTYAQTIAFITRAMIAKGYWVAQPGAPPPAVPIPDGLDLEVRTFAFYAGAIPAVPTSTAGWAKPATRGWFARALWAALDSYWRVDRVP